MMRHEQDCNCDRCEPSSSLSDTILTGVMTVAGVAFAMMSGSTTIVAAVVALLVVVIAFRIGAPMRGAGRQRREK